MAPRGLARRVKTGRAGESRPDLFLLTWVVWSRPPARRPYQRIDLTAYDGDITSLFGEFTDTSPGITDLPSEEESMRGFIVWMLAQAIANSIAAWALVVISFWFVVRWPPQEALVGSSIGGALSPFAWRIYRAARGSPEGPASEKDVKPPL
jgi:hypothetical protein